MKKKKPKRITPNVFDKMPFEKREKLRKKLRENAAYTKSFKTPQSFGAASNCISLTIEEYLASGGNLKFIKGDNTDGE